MTVAEMIKLLEEFPPDARIGAFVSDDEWSGSIKEVSDLYYDKEKNYVDVSADECDCLICRA